MFQRSSMLRKAQTVGKRLASQQAVQKTEASSAVPLTKLDNGLTVVSCNHNDRASRVIACFNAGSRFESNYNRGVSHTIRACAGLTTSQNTTHMATHLLSQLGASINTTGTKEHLLYSLSCGRGAADRLFDDVLAPLLTSNKYLEYEYEEMGLKTTMKYQNLLAQSSPAFNLLDAAHQASFRGGLSNSVICPDSMVSEHSAEMIMDYVGAGFKPARTVLAATGIEHDKLCRLGSSLSFAEADSTLSDNSSFVSSEVRQNTLNTGSVNAALCFSGTALNDQDAIALAVLQHACGTQGHIKRGNSSSQGVIISSLTKSAQAPFDASCFNVNYSDTGLFGISISSQAEDAASLLMALNTECKEIGGGKLTEKQINVAKQRLKASVTMNNENYDNMLEDVAVQVSLLGGYASAAEICNKIDKVSTAQVQKVAKTVFGGKKSIAVIGELMDFPYLQDL